MSAWRVIITDSESMTGVAPVCESPEHAINADVSDIKGDAPNWVYDCCPHPHIETWGEATARLIAYNLTEADAEACS